MYNIQLDIGFEICLILHLSVVKLLVFLNIHFKGGYCKSLVWICAKIYTKSQKFGVNTILIFYF